MLVAGVELGGTKCVCLLASGPDGILAQVRVPTRDPAATLAEVAGVVDEWVREHAVAAIGIASFGPLDLDPLSDGYGRMLETPKPGWSHADIVAPLGRFRLPLAIDTDVNGAALAEGRWGAAQGLASYAYITVGTGIGVGLVIGGRTVTGRGHPEAGHMRVPRVPGDEWPGACPFHGDCVEGLASGPAIAARSGAPADRLPPDSPVWDGVVAALAGMVHNLVLTVAPERVLVGGGIASGQPHLLPRVRSELARSLGGYAHAARIEADLDRYVSPPALGDRAGPLGAIAVALDARRDR